MASHGDAPHKTLTDEEYRHSAKYRHEQVLRVQARREMVKAGLAHPGDHKDVDHIHPLTAGGSGDRSNLRMRSVHANRAFWQGKHMPK